MSLDGARVAKNEVNEMQIGMIGLGRMGSGMTQRLVSGGHDVVAFDLDPAARERAAAAGATPAATPKELVGKLEAPRVVWVMVPAGDPTEIAIDELAELLDSGDAIVDGGNSRYTDSQRRAAQLSTHGIEFADAGVSGGVWGLEEGYCLMVGAAPETFARVEPALRTLAPEGGLAHVGPPGSGHYVKMVHNGVEYALLQAYGEGFELMEAGPFDLDFAQIAELWRHGSVVRSWLLDLAALALAENPTLEGVSDYVEDSGEGRWTLQTAIECAVPIPAISTALFARFASRQDESFSGKLIASLRQQFGGHSVRESGP
jgi:6-phosphogluconate dehydrogenase